MRGNMENKIHTYDPKDLVLSVGGLIIKGFDKTKVVTNLEPDTSYQTGNYPDNSIKSVHEPKISHYEMRLMDINNIIIRLCNSVSWGNKVLKMIDEGLNDFDIARASPCSVEDIMQIKELVIEVSQINECIELHKTDKFQSFKEVTGLLEITFKNGIYENKPKKNPKPFQERRSFKSVKNIGNYKR